ncbi:MAG: hypothetical protein HYY23_15690 [Verrucomicrobia bacterium]|nr:hypothetical protein [Verrucomicrobiota bacterium]
MAQKNTAKKRQTFTITAHGAKTVTLMGDFTNWQEKPISLGQAQWGVWAAQVDLPPGTYHYRFLVDGQWRDDPECSLRVPNAHGSENSVRIVV